MKKIRECPGCHKPSRRMMTRSPRGEKLSCKICSQCWCKVYSVPAHYKMAGQSKAQMKLTGIWKG